MTIKLESSFTEKEVLTYILYGLQLEQAKIQAKMADLEATLRPPVVKVKATVLHNRTVAKLAKPPKKTSRKRR